MIIKEDRSDCNKFNRKSRNKSLCYVNVFKYMNRKNMLKVTLKESLRIKLKTCYVYLRELIIFWFLPPSQHEIKYK